MTLQLTPKYQIGQKFQESLYIKIENHLDSIIYKREVFVSNIKAEYDFKKNEIQYIYELSFIYEDFEYVHSTINEKVLIDKFKSEVRF